MQKLNEDFFQEDDINLNFDLDSLNAFEDLKKGNSKEAKAFRFHIGMRNVKTAVAATLCALLYAFVDRNPTFACIGAIFGMGSDLKDSKLSGGNRLFGTVVGGLLGMLLFYIYIHMYPEPKGITFFLFFLLFTGIIIMVIICQKLVIPGAIQPAGVVLCIILFNTPVEAYISYPLNRILDTAIGVIVALIINVIFSRERVYKIRKFFLSILKKQA